MNTRRIEYQYRKTGDFNIYLSVNALFHLQFLYCSGGDKKIMK